MNFMKQLKEKIYIADEPRDEISFPIAGCTDKEIELVRVGQQVKRLPQSYIEFARVLGGGVGKMVSGSTMRCSHLIDIKPKLNNHYQDKLIEFNFSLPPDAFIFRYSRELFIYFHTDNEDDNPVCYQFSIYTVENPQEVGKFTEYLQFLYEEYEEITT